MNIILPTAYRGNIDINFSRRRLTLQTDNSFSQLEQAKHHLTRHYNNGLSKYLHKIRLSIVTDLKECQKIWQHFSPNSNLFDLWDLRLAFHRSYGGKPYFMILTKNDQLMACLPLFYQSTLKKYTWFGSDWMENVRFFTVDPFFIPILLYFAPRPLSLNGIDQTDAKLLPKFVALKSDGQSFFLDLAKFGSMQTYLAGLPKKKRYNLKRDYQKILQLEPTVVLDRLSHFKDMITITKQRFHDKGEITDIEQDPYIEGAFSNLLTTPSSSFEIHLQSVIINRRIAAVDMLAYHQGVLYPLRGGNDVSHFSGIGNFLNYQEMNQAFELNLQKIDFLQYAYGWKQNYLMSQPRYEIVLNDE